MKSITVLAFLVGLFATTAFGAAAHWGAKCGTCNPVSGENHCDATTSCINTGSRFHCACRAGYKATEHNHDISKQFRLNVPDYEFLVFTPEWTTCDTLCDNPYGASKELCAEVPVVEKCEV
ncbi:hypothetical protein BDV18DRAFT_159394 [Aspergillus unguis]